MARSVKIVLDIETIPCDEETRAKLPPVKVPGTIKDENIAEWEITNLSKLKEKQFLETSFDGSFGRITCIGLLIIGDGTESRGIVLYGLNERQILFEFWKLISQYNKIQFITHNGFNFDFPFILKRSIIHSIKPTYAVNLAKFRNDFIFDTMAVWANWDVRSSIKLDTLAHVLNVGEKSCAGSEVYSLYLEAKHEGIADYCFHDVYLTYAVYCRMVYEKAVDKSSIYLEKKAFQ